MTNTNVQLKVYQHIGEATYIDTIEAKSFEDFVLIAFDDTKSPTDLDEIAAKVQSMFPTKQVVLIPESMNISFYGVEKEEDHDNRSLNSQLLDPETS